MALFQRSDFIIVEQLLTVNEVIQWGEVILIFALNFVFHGIQLLLQLVVILIFFFQFDLFVSPPFAFWIA
jgi:hypothetical protein